MTPDTRPGRYDTLTGAEAAKFAFTLLVAKRGADVALIDDELRNSTDTGRSREFVSWFDRIFATAAYWGIQRWAAESRMHSAHALMLIAGRDRDTKTLVDAARAQTEHELRILALELALDQAFRAIDIDPDDVRRLADVGRYVAPDVTTVADPEHVTNLVAELTAILHGTGLPAHLNAGARNA